MKKIFILLFILIFTYGFSVKNESMVYSSSFFDLEKKYDTRIIEACALGNTKSYMDYRAVTNTSSKQYWFIRNNMTVNTTNGFLYDDDGFIGVALGSFYGEIGSRYYFTLETGITLPVVKIDEKADKDTDINGCYHLSDGSVIEFVIDSDIANEYYGYYNNGLVLQGNFSNYELYKGDIVKVEEVLDNLNPKHLEYYFEEESNNYSIYNYGAGY